MYGEHDSSKRTMIQEYEGKHVHTDIKELRIILKMWFIFSIRQFGYLYHVVGGILPI